MRMAHAPTSMDGARSSLIDSKSITDAFAARFALDRPTITINSFNSHGSNAKGRHRHIDSEWELNSELEEEDKYYPNGRQEGSTDAETYRPSH